MAAEIRSHLITALALLALALALAAGGLALANASSTTVHSAGTVEVTGTSSMVVHPDTLTVDLRVSVVRSSAAAALSLDNQKTQLLDQVFRKAGVPTKDLSTTNVSVTQNYNQNGATAGYVASNDVTVTLTQLAKAGAVLSAAQSQVGNDVSIQDTSYSVANQVKALESDRAAAVRNAESNARVLAEAAGSSLGAIVRITDQSTTTTPPPEPFSNAAAAKSATATPVPLNPGTESIQASVDCVFSIG